MYTQQINKNTLRKEYGISKVTLIFATTLFYFILFYLILFLMKHFLRSILWPEQYGAVE